MTHFRYLRIKAAATAAAFLLLLFLSGCGEKNITEPATELPALTDPIPYGVLGSGKIAFERVGPYPGKYEGCYVIDLDRKQTWGQKMDLSANYCLSPDGTKIAYAEFTEFALYDIHIADISFKNARNISDLSGQDRYPVWDPSGEHIFFWVEGTGAPAPQLFIRPVAPDSARPKLVVTFLFGLYILQPTGRVSVSPAGKVAFVTNYNQSKNLAGLYTLDISGKNFKRIVPLPEGRYFESPVFSPDGSKIALLSVKRDAEAAYHKLSILLVDTACRQAATIAELEAKGSKEWHSPGKDNNVSLVWSPDGRQLLFNLPEGNFVSHLYVINADGTGLTQITSAKGVTDRLPSWSR